MKEKLINEMEQYLICSDGFNTEIQENVKALFGAICKMFKIERRSERNQILHDLYFRAALEEVIDEDEFLQFMLKDLPAPVLDIHELAYGVQDAVFAFINAVNAEDNACMEKEVETDGNMLIFHDEETWRKFIVFFDSLGLDFTTGEPDGDHSWYIDFEFSDGIKS